MKNIPIDLKNGYILIQDIKNETVTQSGLYVPEEQYNRFARVMKTYEGSSLKEGDIVVKPIGRSTPLTIDGVKYDCIKEGFIFAKIVDDEG
jgi:co-chaperonin GroES (HSP10)